MCQFSDIRKIKCLNYFSACNPYQFILIVNKIRGLQRNESKSVKTILYFRNYTLDKVYKC